MADTRGGGAKGGASPPPPIIFTKELVLKAHESFHFKKWNHYLKCHCNEKIFDPILNTTERHFHSSLNDVFSFSIFCFVLEILRFFETCKLGVSDVIFSRIINYIYQMVNISVNSRQKFFKLCMAIAIC